MSALPDLPPTEAVTQEALTWPERAAALAITTPDTYTRAAELLLGIKDLRKRIAETFDPHIKRAFDAHKALVREKQTAEAPLVEAEGTLKLGMGRYDTEQEAKRLAEQRRLEEEARAREEQRRLEEAAALEREAVQTGDNRLAAEAQALLDTPVAPVVVPVAKATPKVAGISYRDVWKFRITDPTVIPREYLMPNEVAIAGVVRSLKGATKIPGVQVYSEKTVAAGSR